MDKKLAQIIYDEMSLGDVFDNEEELELLKEHNPRALEAYEAIRDAADGEGPLVTPTFGSKPYFFVEGKLYDRHGKEVDPGECVIFKVTDKDLHDLLDFYGDLSENKEHRQAVARLADEVYIWQKGNDRVKAAD